MNQALEFLQSQVGRDARLSPSPLMRWLNPVIRRAEQGSLELEYAIRQEWLNPMNMLHGGIFAAIMDDAIGATVFSLGESHFYSTISLHVDYFAPAREDEVILARAEIVKKGRQLIHAECEIRNNDGSRLLARGHSNLIKTEIAK